MFKLEDLGPPRSYREKVARKALGLGKNRARQVERDKPGNVQLETTDPEQLALELDILESNKLRELRDRRHEQEMLEDLRLLYRPPEETTISKALSNPYVQGGIGVAGTAGLLYALNRATRD